MEQFQIKPEKMGELEADLTGRTRFRFMLPILLGNMIVVVSACTLMGLQWRNIPAIRSLGPVVLPFSRMAIIVIAFLLYFRLILFPLIDRIRRRHVIEVLRRHGYDLCPNCGYSWTGLTGSIITCPECGVAGQSVQSPSEFHRRDAENTEVAERENIGKND